MDDHIAGNILTDGSPLHLPSVFLFFPLSLFCPRLLLSLVRVVVEAFNLNLQLGAITYFSDCYS